MEKTKKKNRKRIVRFLMIFVLVCGVLATGALAAEEAAENGEAPDMRDNTVELVIIVMMTAVSGLTVALTSFRPDKEDAE